MDLAARRVAGFIGDPRIVLRCPELPVVVTGPLGAAGHDEPSELRDFAFLLPSMPRNGDPAPSRNPN